MSIAPSDLATLSRMAGNGNRTTVAEGSFCDILEQVRGFSASERKPLRIAFPDRNRAPFQLMGAEIEQWLRKLP